MKKRITSLYVILMVIFSVLSPGITAVAAATVFHEEDGYRVRYNLDGSYTMDLDVSVENVVDEEAAARYAEEYTEADQQEATVSMGTSLGSAAGGSLMTLTFGEMSVSFTPIKIAGQMTLAEWQALQETAMAEETPEPSASPEVAEEPSQSPSPSASPEAEETPEVMETPEPENTENPIIDETPEPSSSPTVVTTLEPTTSPTEAPTPEPTPEPTQEPTPEPTEEPVPEIENESTTENEDQPASDSTDALSNTASVSGFWRDFLGFRSAHAEDAMNSTDFTHTSTEVENIEGLKDDHDTQSDPSDSQDEMFEENTPAVDTPSQNNVPAGPQSGFFSNVFDEVTDVRISGSGDSVKEDIIIRHYLGKHVFAYNVTTVGLTLVQAGSQILLNDEHGELVATIPSPDMWDSAGAYSTDIGVTLSGGGNSYTMAYTPNDAWLSDENRAYPVTVDPSVRSNPEYQTVGSTSDGYYFLPGNILTSGSIIVNSEASSFVRFSIPKVLTDKRGQLVISDATFSTTVTRVDSAVSVGYYASSSGISQGKFLGSQYISSTSQKLTCNLYELFAEALKYGGSLGNVGISLWYMGGTGGNGQPTLWAQGSKSGNLSIRVTYRDLGANKLAVTTNTYGNDVNSGTGSVILNWPSDTNFSKYFIYLSNGASYTKIGETTGTSFTTKGAGIWPTESQAASGKSTLMGGGELATLPTQVYKNSGGTVASNTHYYFRVVPVDRFGYALDPEKAGWSGSILLPDRNPPAQATSVQTTIGPGAGEITVAWNGIRDATPNGGIVDTMGNGRIEYMVDGDPNGQTGWLDTGSKSSSGSFVLDTSTLVADNHVVYVRGKDGDGNYGASNYATFIVDREPPSTPTVTVQPNDWTADEYIYVSWDGLTDDMGIYEAQVKIGGGDWISTGINSQSHSNYALLATGEQGVTTVSVRGVDLAGNKGEAGTDTVQVDYNAPTVSGLTTDPTSWTNSSDLVLQWSKVEDIDSGLKNIQWRVNSDPWSSVPLSSADNGMVTIDISELTDGDHTAYLNVHDVVNNEETHEKQLLVDHTKPELAILLPSEGIVAGVPEVWGSIYDLSLDTWTLTATGENGNTITVATGGENRSNTLLGRLNTSLFADNEKIRLTLEANDLAGNSHSVTGSYLVVNNSAKPIEGEVGIESPSHGDKITELLSGLYELGYDLSEGATYVYIDGKLHQVGADGQTFDINPLLFDEDTLHTLVVISLDADGNVFFSEGLAAYQVLADTFVDDGLIDEIDGLDLTSDGATGAGWLTSTYSSIGMPVFAITLAADYTGTASFEYDAGDGWKPISVGEYVVLDTPAETIQLRATVDGTLHSWQLHGVAEMNPTVFLTGVSSPLSPLTILNTTLNRALVPLETSPSGLTQIRQFDAGQLISESDKINALRAQENGNVSISVTGTGADGTLYGSNARTETLLREVLPVAENNVITRQVTASGAMQVLRVVTDSADASISYSIDGSSYTPIAQGSHINLSSPSASVWVRAEVTTGIPFAWHVEGSILSEKTIPVKIMQSPSQVVLYDYSEYDESTDHFELKWSDPNTADNTLKNTHEAVILKDGTRIDEVSGTSHKMASQKPVPSYSVRIERRYTSDGVVPQGDPLLTRQSVEIKAVYQKMEKGVLPAEIKIHKQEQSEDVTRLYNGQYTFQENPTPPPMDDQLLEKLLGMNEFCALGFEPINFNTGNFILQAQDANMPDVGNVSLNVVRTYNAQSTQLDGPFGARWAYTYGQVLALYEDGRIGYMNDDGAIFYFTPQADGTFKGNDDDFRVLTLDKDGVEYTMQMLDGTKQIFDGDTGFMTKMISAQGAETILDRDDFGVLTGLVMPSGARTEVESDHLGHIISITAPGGQKINYIYDKEGMLASVIDPAGNKTRYSYGKHGLMDAWYDANGTQQVYNEYDEESRVVYQKDAFGGEYALEYFEDYTQTTDAEGKTQEIHFDEYKRTTRMVDGEGGETRYIYNEQGALSGVIDASGQLTSYEYDARGNATKTILPNGATTERTYDKQGNLTSLTDPNGNKTEYVYDDKNNLVKQKNPDGGVLTYTYNALGQCTTATDAEGGFTQYIYSGANLTYIVDALGYTTSYTYDEAGHVTAEIDALGNTTTYTYDAMGNQTSITFADGTKVSYTYDAMGNQTSMTDMLRRKTSYKYDALGNLLETTYPDYTKETRTYTPSYQLASVTNAMGETTSYTYDAAGNKVAETDAMGNVTAYAYDETGRMVQETLPTGVGSTYEYDDLTGLVSAVENKAGVRFDLAYDLAGNLLSESKPNGAANRTEYDSMNRPIVETNPLGGVTRYTYDKMGRLTAAENPLGGITRYAYDAAGNLIRETNPAGGITSYIYDALGRLTATKDAQGAVTQYAYDTTGSLVSVTDALGNVETYAYDGAGRITEVIDPLGGKVQLAYDKMDNIAQVTNKDSGRHLTKYDKIGRVMEEKDALGAVTRYEYDPLGQVTKITDALRRETAYVYDVVGNLLAMDEPGGRHSTYVYDEASRLTQSVDPQGVETTLTYNVMSQVERIETDGQAITFTYDLAGNISEIIGESGQGITYAYDAMGNQTSAVYPDGSTDTWRYDKSGRLIAEELADGQSIAYAYDALGRLVQTRQGERITAFEYDQLGQLIRTTLPDGSETALSYDAVGNLLGVTDALGGSTGFGYDAASRLTNITDASGNAYDFAYDLLGNVTQETDPLGNTTRYAYDKASRLTQVTDATGKRTQYAYDELDNLTRVRDALGRDTVYDYDLLGNLLSETDALGNIERYEYTQSSDLAKAIRPDGTEIEYLYDETGFLMEQKAGGETVLRQERTEDGLRVVSIGTDGDTTYQYNAKEQLVSVTHPAGDVVGYAYDDLGRKTKLTYPDGSEATYEYDNMDRLVKVTEPDGAITEYTYDALGRRIETAGENLRTTYVYDVLGNIVQQETTGDTSLALAYAYDALGRIISEERTEDGEAITSEYSYDRLGQLVSFAQSTGYSEKYAYDAVGNMTQKTLDGQRISMSYNKINQLTRMQSGNQRIDYAYDANGNLTNKSLGELTDTYAYDALGNLSAFTGYDGYAQQYAYSALGIRTEKQEKGDANRLTLEAMLEGKTVEALEGDTQAPNAEAWVKTSYIQDITQLYPQVLVEKSSAAGDTVYGYGLERLSATATESALKTTYVYDVRGSVAQKVAGSAIESMRYAPFGGQLGDTAVSGYGYNGEHYDAATGMLHLRARQYEPGMNRFGQKDAARKTLDAYSYCINNPVKYADIDGLRYVVVSGGEYKTRNENTSEAGEISAYSFIESALKEIGELRAESPNERIDWIVANEGWSVSERNEIRIAAEEYGNVSVKFVNSTAACTSFVNSIGQMGKDQGYDPIRYMSFFSHGLVNDGGVISLGYNGDNQTYNRKLDIGIGDVKTWKANSFDNPIIKLYSCNSATAMQNSLAKAFADQIPKSSVYAYAGRSEYSNIVNPSYGLGGVVGFLGKIMDKLGVVSSPAIEQARNLRDQFPNSFIPTGALYTPTAAKGVAAYAYPGRVRIDEIPSLFNSPVYIVPKPQPPIQPLPTSRPSTRSSGISSVYRAVGGIGKVVSAVSKTVSTIGKVFAKGNSLTRLYSR